MQLIRKLLSSVRPSVTRHGKIRGLSTAELVGIIVIVGILGALGGTYISGLIGQSKTNTGNQNAQSLNTVMASAFAAGATVGTGGGSAGNIDLTSGTTAITDLTSGVVVGSVTYKMNPAVGTPANYVLAGSTPTTASFSFTTTAGAAP